MIVCTYDITDDRVRVRKVVRGDHLWKVDLHISDGVQKIEKSIRNKQKVNIVALTETVNAELRDMVSELTAPVTSGGFIITLLR